MRRRALDGRAPGRWSGPRAVWALVALLLAPGAAAAEAPLTVFAASDLVFAFQAIVPAFEAAAGARVTLVLGSTGNLARQIEQGAPADVFFAADQSFVDLLIQRDRLLAETRTLYARGRLALVTARGVGPRLADLRELARPAIRHVAIANPRHAPYGRAAEEALRRVGVWAAVAPKLVHGETVRHALQFVQTGAADAGLVALAVARVPEVEWALVDGALHTPLDQAAGVVRTSARRELARTFIGFVIGPVGEPLLRRFGFARPGEP